MSRTTVSPTRRSGGAATTTFCVNGQKGYHGVAIVSRRPFLATVEARLLRQGRCPPRFGDDRRSATATSSSTISTSRPAATSPIPAINEKFAHKLAFLDEMRTWLTGPETDRKAILVGDLNIAPLRARRLVAQAAAARRQPHAGRDRGPRGAPRGRRLGRRDAPLRSGRHRSSTPGGATARSTGRLSDRGRRLDHIWVTPHLADRLGGIEVIRAARGWKRPSDHVPVIVRLGAEPRRGLAPHLPPVDIAESVARPCRVRRPSPSAARRAWP